jgi:hypothetical protein
LAPSRKASSSAWSAPKASRSSGVSSSRGSSLGGALSTDRRLAKKRAYAVSRAADGSFGDLTLSQDDTVAEDKLSCSCPSAPTSAACVIRPSRQHFSRRSLRRCASSRRPGSADNIDPPVNRYTRDVHGIGVTRSTGEHYLRLGSGTAANVLPFPTQRTSRQILTHLA